MNVSAPSGRLSMRRMSGRLAEGVRRVFRRLPLVSALTLRPAALSMW